MSFDRRDQRPRSDGRIDLHFFEEHRDNRPEEAGYDHSHGHGGGYAQRGKQRLRGAFRNEQIERGGSERQCAHDEAVKKSDAVFP